MRIVHISDTHGKHAELDLPAGDILVCSGDVSEYGIDVEMHAFLNWLRKQPFKHKVLVGGNHDEILEECDGVINEVFDLTGIHYLKDSSVELDGLKFYGVPSVPSEFSMAFTYYPGESADIWNKVPNDTDVLVSHGPPQGVLDNGHGCEQLKNRVEELSLKAHLFGHIHEAKGIEKVDQTFFSNGAESVHVLNIE